MTVTDTSPQHNTYYSIWPFKRSGMFYFSNRSVTWLAAAPTNENPAFKIMWCEKECIDFTIEAADWNTICKIMQNWTGNILNVIENISLRLVTLMNKCSKTEHFIENFKFCFKFGFVSLHKATVVNINASCTTWFSNVNKANQYQLRRFFFLNLKNSWS